MKKVIEYLPENVEFVLGQKPEKFVPESLGKFKTVKDVQKFLNENKFISLNPRIHAIRLMDEVEINDLRGMYIEELEESLPDLKRNAAIAAINSENAKRILKEQNERVSAAETKVQMLVNEINAGTKEMQPEQSKTFELACKNQYLYYTLINGELKLCEITDIPEHERSEIFNSTEANLEALQKLKKQVKNTG